MHGMYGLAGNKDDIRPLGCGLSTTTGVAGVITVPYAGIILSATIDLDTSGSVVVNVWKDRPLTTATAPSSANSICGAVKPTVSSAYRSVDTTLAGWTRTFAKGDRFAFNIDSASGFTGGTLVLEVKRTG